MSTVPTKISGVSQEDLNVAKSRADLLMEAYAQSQNLSPAIGKGAASGRSHPTVACLAFAAGARRDPTVFVRAKITASVTQ
jgi:hypothetical protein